MQTKRYKVNKVPGRKQERTSAEFSIMYCLSLPCRFDPGLAKLTGAHWLAGWPAARPVSGGSGGSPAYSMDWRSIPLIFN